MEQQAWAINELGLANLGDDRLNARLIYLAEKFAAAPESSISQVFGNWAETKAAYRFFSNDKVSDQEILASHIQATKERCEAEQVVLAIQDTTYFNYTTHTKTEGLGPLNSHKGLNIDKLVASGIIMHTSFAVSEEGLPLGILDQKIYSRDELSAEIKELKKQTHNTAFPIEERESYRWLASLKNSNNNLKEGKNKLITICDREADIYEFFKLATDSHSQVIVRARHDRTVNKSSPFSRTTGEGLWSLLKQAAVTGHLEVHIPKTAKEQERVAICEVRFKEVSISPTYYNMKNQSEKLPALTLKAVYVLEKDAPAEVEPLTWMLLTNLEVKILNKP